MRKSKDGTPSVVHRRCEKWYWHNGEPRQCLYNAEPGKLTCERHTDED
ncbi:hypothetical protein SEA_SUCHA_7 [Microbacterium phage Sucha]|nr:hypothetical protein SEA_SUCHA_7 [Microbacterium phage Sucha]